jgi:hypothetical protein
MKAERLEHWFKRYIAVRKVGCWVGAPFMLIAGAIVLFLTFWLTYFVIFLADQGFNELIQIFSGHAWHLSHNVRLILSAIFIVLLFFGRARTTPWQVANFRPVRENAMLDAIADSQEVGPFAKILSNPQTSANIIAQALYFGPHLVLGSWNLVRQAGWLSSINQAACVSALELLLSRPGRVTQSDFASERPHLRWPEIRSGLSGVSGVLITNEAMQITNDFRDELSGVTESS